MTTRTVETRKGEAREWAAHKRKSDILWQAFLNTRERKRREKEMLRIQKVERTPDSLLRCSECLKNLARDEVWLPDDTRDGRLFCYHCAPDDAIRMKDLS